MAGCVPGDRHGPIGPTRPMDTFTQRTSSGSIDGQWAPAETPNDANLVDFDLDTRDAPAVKSVGAHPAIVSRPVDQVEETVPVAPPGAGTGPFRAVGAIDLAAFRTEIEAAARARATTDRVGHRAVMRVLDVLLSLVALVLVLPLMLLIGLVIMIDSPGPAVFRQQRVGRNGVPFRFCKFRTMWADARQRFPELYRYDFSVTEVDTMFFKLADDPRLTRFGRILRRTSLDELPNLLNVLAGHMSLVGPRPEIPEMLPYYRSEQLVKFSFRPGLTGLAQVSGRNILSFQQTLSKDLEYVRKRSLSYDVLILLRTPLTVIKMVGAL